MKTEYDRRLEPPEKHYTVNVEMRIAITVEVDAVNAERAREHAITDAELMLRDVEMIDAIAEVIE